MKRKQEMIECKDSDTKVRKIGEENKRSQGKKDVLRDKTEELLKEITNYIYDELGSGHTEAVYHKALKHELYLRKIPFDTEIVVPFSYKGKHVGFGRADIVLNKDSAVPGIKPMVVELKANKYTFPPFFEFARVRSYMKFLGISQGVIINFSKSHKSCKVHRVSKKRD